MLINANIFKIKVNRNSSRSKFLALILVISFIIWIKVISSIQINFFPDNPFYYFIKLPYYYWIGMLLIIFGSFFLLKCKYIHKRHVHIFELLVILLVVLYNFGTPSFIYTNPRTIDVYGINELLKAIELNETEFRSNSPLYKNEFEISLLFFSFICNLLNIDYISFAKYYPIGFMLLMAFSIYAISNRISKNYRIIGPVFYISLAWVQEFHACPQSLALLLSLFFIYLFIINYDIKLESNIIQTKIMILVIWLTLSMSHPLSPIICLMGLISVLILTLFLNQLLEIKAYRFLNIAKQESAISISLLTLLGLIYLSYIAYESNFILSRMITFFELSYNNFLYGETFAVTDRMASNPTNSYLVCYYIRWGIILFSLGLGGISIVILFLANRLENYILFIIFLFASYCFIGFFMVLSGLNSYGPDRIFIFLLIPCSLLYTIAYSADLPFNKIHYTFKSILIIFMIFSMLIFPLSKYSSDPYSFVSDSEFSGKMFLLKNPTPNLIIYTNYEFNLVQLKTVGGKTYINSFYSQNLGKIYASGQSNIYIPYSGR